MEKLIQIAEKEWAVVSGAPITMALIAIAVWAIVRHLYKDRLARARELLDLKSAQLSEIQNRTGATSPEEVIDRLSKVETELRELGETDFAAAFEKGLKIEDLPDLP